MPQFVIIRVVKDDTPNGQPIYYLETIRKAEDSIEYKFLLSLQAEIYHMKLLNIPVVKNALNSMSDEINYRNFIGEFHWMMN